MFNWYKRWQYKPGRIIRRFIAKDVIREIKVVSNENFADGILVCQVRTENVLYRSKGLVDPVEFGAPITIEINKLWEWSGGDWGGMPDGKSIITAPSDGERRA